MSEILPVIVADLAEERAHGALLEVAHEKGNAWVPLITAPVDPRLHLLEVYTPGRSEPLRLLARPLGPPTEKGFPLALSLPEALPPMDHDTIGQSRPPVRLEEDEDEQEVTAQRMPLPPPRVPQIAVPATSRLDTPTSVRRIPVTAPEPQLSERHRADLAGMTPPPPSPTNLQDKLIGRQLAGGKLEIESLVGSGSIGAVYRARHRELRIFVAVKILHESFQHDVEFCRRFYAEALAVSRVDHPNLVRVYDFGQEPDGLLYLSMEFLDGTTLRSLLERRGRLAETRIVELMLQVTAGLAHAHGKGLIHRDVRPDNVVVVATHDDEGTLSETVKILDFGIALNKASGDNAQRQGNPSYMSPEQCRAEELDERSDIYACGIMMYELATGKVPFWAEKPITIVNRQLSMPAPLIAESRPEIDPRLDLIVQRALKKAKADRYTSMRELRADLKDMLQAGTRPASAPPSGPMPASAPISAQPAMSLPPPAMPSVSIPPAAPVSEPAPSEPPAASATPPPPRPSKAPEWLEDRGDSIARFLNGMATGSARATELADVLSNDAVAWLKPFVEERDPNAFAQKLAELDRAVRILAHRADAKALWAVSSTVHGLATEGTQGPNTRAAKAAALLRLFADPGMLGPVAERLLTPDDDAREAAQTLLVRAKVAGAYALYGARVKLAVHPRARAPFVAAMSAVGEGAWPVVRAALEKIPPAALTGGHPLASELAEDLLLCVPSVRDEAAGHLVATYVRSTVPSLCRAATRALARLWAERARPLLLGLLANEDDGVRIAAIVGLREIGAVDEHAARRIAPLTTRTVPHELRVAALQALGSMTIEARPVAVPILAQLVRDGAAPDDATLLAAATSLVKTAGPDAHGVIRERADRSSEPLRGQLLALLA